MHDSVKFAPPRTRIRVQAEVSGNNTQITSFMEFLAVETLFTPFDMTRSSDHLWNLFDGYVGDG